MNTLTYSVIGLFVVVMLVVIGFNFWQSRVNRREAERLFRQENGALDEQANIARRRRTSFSRPPAEDPALEELDDVDLPLYANDVEGEEARRADAAGILSPRRRGDAGTAGATEPHVGDDGGAGLAANQEEGGRGDRVRRSQFADDLRRITDRMPTSADEDGGSNPVRPGQAAPAPAQTQTQTHLHPQTHPHPQSQPQGQPQIQTPETIAARPASASAAAVGGADSGLHDTSLPTGPDRHAAAPLASAQGSGSAMAATAPAQSEAAGAGGESPAPMSALASAEPAARFPDIDLAIDLNPASPINSDRLIALASSLRHAGSKPIRIEIGRGDGRFLPLQSGVMVAVIRLTVLLANRQGPLNAVELSDFMSSVAVLASQVGADFSPPDLNQILGRARAVDSLAAELDTQVEIFVETPERQSATQFAKLGRQLELYDRGGGNFACLSDGGDVIYMMSVAHPDAIRFTLDVPRVPAGADPWRVLVTSATRCAELVGGRVIDAEGRGLSVGMIDAVARQLTRRHDQLSRAGLEPGSTAALRVFN